MPDESEGACVFCSILRGQSADARERLHVIPRFRGDGFGLRFGPGYGKQAERSDLDRIAAEIKAGVGS